jgi:hypothetical protein
MSMICRREQRDSMRALRRSRGEMHAMFKNVAAPPFLYVTGAKALA